MTLHSLRTSQVPQVAPQVACIDSSTRKIKFVCYKECFEAGDHGIIENGDKLTLPECLVKGQASLMLNFSSTSSTYLYYDNHNFFDFLSRKICISKICHPELKSFISNDLNNPFIKLPIISVSLFTINILSTYNRKMIYLPIIYICPYVIVTHHK